MSNGIKLIQKEREKQIKKWGLEHDADHNDGELITAALFALTMGDEYRQDWNFEYKLDKEMANRKLDHDKIIQKRYRIAGALIVAELDQIRD